MWHVCKVCTRLRLSHVSSHPHSCNLKNANMQSSTPPLLPTNFEQIKTITGRGHHVHPALPQMSNQPGTIGSMNMPETTHLIPSPSLSGPQVTWRVQVRLNLEVGKMVVLDVKPQVKNIHPRVCFNSGGCLRKVITLRPATQTQICYIKTFWRRIRSLTFIFTLRLPKTNIVPSKIDNRWKMIHFLFKNGPTLGGTCSFFWGANTLEN